MISSVEQFAFKTTEALADTRIPGHVSGLHPGDPLVGHYFGTLPALVDESPGAFGSLPSELLEHGEPQYDSALETARLVAPAPSKGFAGFRVRFRTCVQTGVTLQGRVIRREYCELSWC